MKRDKSRQKKKFDKSTRLAFICAIISCILILLYMNSLEAQTKKAQQDAMSKYGGEQVEVCIARKTISAGQKISESDIEVKSWLASMLPENSITNKADCVGKTLASSVVKGEVVSSSRFQKDAKSFNIPDNMTAISIPLTDVSSVGGSLKVGDKIDIYATGSSATDCIASKVEVLETSKDDDDSETKWITIAVRSELSKQLVAAAQKTELYVVKPSEVQSLDDDDNSVDSLLETAKAGSTDTSANSGQSKRDSEAN